MDAVDDDAVGEEELSELGSGTVDGKVSKVLSRCQMATTPSSDAEAKRSEEPGANRTMLTVLSCRLKEALNVIHSASSFALSRLTSAAFFWVSFELASLLLAEGSGESTIRHNSCQLICQIFTSRSPPPVANRSR